MKPLIYLDHNATTPLDPRVAEAIRDASLRAPYNPGSLHQFGRSSHDILANAREDICRHLGARVDSVPADRLLVTSGGTESNNLILAGIPWTKHPERNELVVSAVEHPSILAPARELERHGIVLKVVSVDEKGLVDLDQLAACLTPRTALVSIQLANHETGVIQPLSKIVPLCHDQGIPVHADGAQFIGKEPFHFREIGLDAVTIVPHKFYGPRGVGGLLMAPDLRLEPLLRGGPQQGELRAGTESVACVVGFEHALRYSVEAYEARLSHLSHVGNLFWQGIESRCSEVRLVGRDSPRLCHTFSLIFPGINRQAMAIALDLQGIACSTGSACASGSHEPSPVLLAMGLPRDEVQSALRFSLGMQNTVAEVELAVDTIVRVYRQLKVRAKSSQF